MLVQMQEQVAHVGASVREHVAPDSNSANSTATGSCTGVMAKTVPRFPAYQLSDCLLLALADCGGTEQTIPYWVCMHATGDSQQAEVFCWMLGGGMAGAQSEVRQRRAGEVLTDQSTAA
jgi:hypothetical protein